MTSAVFSNWERSLVRDDCERSPGDRNEYTAAVVGGHNWAACPRASVRTNGEGPV
jgi:hypothetical protein